MILPECLVCFFFFNDTATTEIYTLSLHDALPICCSRKGARVPTSWTAISRGSASCSSCSRTRDRKSTRLNSSHSQISYAVFCLKKKRYINTGDTRQWKTRDAPAAPSRGIPHTCRD